MDRNDRSYSPSPMMLANMKLLQKQQLLKIERLGGLAEIQKLVEAGEDEEARKLALNLRGSSEWGNILSIFRAERPAVRCTCGAEASVTLNEEALIWTKDETCLNCAVADRGKKESEELTAYVASVISDPREILARIGIPEIYRNASKEDFGKGFEDVWGVNNGFFFYGQPGSGKTRIATAIVREEIPRMVVRKKDFKWEIGVESLPIFITMSDLIMDLHSSTTANGMDEWDSTSKVVKSLYGNSLVVIDDFDIYGQPSWILMVIFVILDRRYRSNRRTIITSQKTILDIKDTDAKIAGRIAGMCKLRRMTL